MRQQIKVTTSVAIQLSIKQKQKHYHSWPLVRRPDGGSHRWLMRACERERAPSPARIIESGYLKLDTVAVYEIFRHPTVQKQLLGLPTMLAFSDENGNFELKKMTLKDIHTVTVERDVEQAKKLGVKLNAIITGRNCCSECDKINGSKLPFEEILQNPILPYHKCLRPTYCNCYYLFEAVKDSNSNVIKTKY